MVKNSGSIAVDVEQQDLIFELFYATIYNLQSDIVLKIYKYLNLYILSTCFSGT